MKRINLLLILFLFCLALDSGFVIAEEDTKKNQVGEVFELGEIVVTANSGITNLATTVTEITAGDISERGAQTAADALEMVPGVDIQQAGKNAWVFLRGFDQEDVKVLIDGVPAYQTYDKVVDLSLLPVDSISKITVTKGASSVLYGANTFGGVINIITKKGGREPGGQVTASFGENSTQNYVLNYGGSKDAFNYWFTFSHRASDGFDLSDDFDPMSEKYGIDSDFMEDGGLRNLSDYEMNTFSTKLGYDPDNGSKLYVSFDYHDNEKGIPTSASRYWSFVKWNQWHLNLVGEKEITDIISTRARLYYVSHKDTIEDVNPILYPLDYRKWFERSSYDDHSIGAEVQTSFNFGTKSNLTVGLNYLKDNHKQQDFLDDESYSVQRGWDLPGYLDEEEYEAETYTIAIEDEIRLMDNDLSFVLGVSYDYYNPTKAYEIDNLPDSTDSFNPQVGAVYNISDNTSIHASAGKKIRFPRLKELYSDMAGGDETLEPQETIAYEIGADHFFTSDIKVSAAFFYNDITDLIERIRDPETGDRFYTNVGEAAIQGLEFAMDYKVSKSLGFGSSYTYLSTFDDTNNTRLQNRPRHKFAFDVRYWILPDFFTSLQASYSSGAYEENADDQIVQVPGFFLLNMRVNKSFGEIMGMKDVSLFFDGNNLFDKDYSEGGNPQAGISFLMGCNLKF